MKYIFRISALLIVFLFCQSVFAVDYSVQKGNKFFVVEDVYFTYGDKQIYKDINYNHSGWGKGSVFFEFFEGVSDDNYGWLRIPFICTEKTPDPLALFLPQNSGQVEYYLNEKRIYPHNELKPNQLGIPAIVVVSPHLIENGTNILAVRTRIVGSASGFLGPIIVGAQHPVFSHFLSYMIKYSSFPIACICIALFILAIYFSHKTEKSYLFFALLALCVGIWSAGVKGLPLLLLNHKYVFYFTSHVSALLIVIFEILFIQFFFNLRGKLLLKVLLAFYSILLLLVLSELVVSGDIFYYYRYLYQPFMISLVLSQIIILVITLKLIIRKVQFAARIFVGVFCIALPGSMMFLYYLETPLIPFEPPIIEGFFAMIVVFASVLASRYAKTFNDLAIANRELKVLDHLKDDFLAVTSHELRTPLTGIIGLSESLSMNHLDEESRQSVDLIKKSAEHLSSLVNDILDFSKINAGKADLYVTEFNLCSTIQTVLSLLLPQANAKNIALSFDCSSVPLMIRADQRRIRQILINLVGNALKYTDEGSVTVRVEHDNGLNRISVIDSGKGIDPEIRGKLFRPFERGAAGLTGEQPGSGLGLSISKRLAQLHGGDIEINSVAGQGSVFTMVIPEKLSVQAIGGRAKAESVALPGRENESALPGATFADENISTEALSSFSKSIRYSAHILAVDDDPINLWAIASLCRKYGHTVITAKRGEEALDIIARETVELVLLDLMLPGMSGLEVCEKIRKTYTERFIPVIIMTAHGDGSREMLRGFESGANDYLGKPFDVNVLMMRIENQLAIKHMLDMEKTIVNGLRKERDSVSNLAQRSAVLRDFALQMSEWEAIIREDLDIASQFQTKLMNKADIKGLDYSLFYKPILRIGGDVYDIIEYRPGIVRVFLADATGHGINASLNTVKILSEYAAIKHALKSPGEIIRHMNQLFHKTFADYQIIFTCIIADIDLNESKVCVAMAGHIEQLLITPDAAQPLKLRGPIIGLKEDSFYEERTYPFEKGAALVLFSDGLFDFFEGGDPFWETLSLFSTELIDPLKKGQSFSASQISNQILSSEQRLQTRANQDDITMLVLKNA